MRNKMFHFNTVYCHLNFSKKRLFRLLSDTLFNKYIFLYFVWYEVTCLGKSPMINLGDLMRGLWGPPATQSSFYFNSIYKPYDM